MDENFELFLEDMGPAFDKRYVPIASIERYRGKLPDQLLAYWDEHGWCGHAEGLFWTVNPQDYEPALEAWIGNTTFAERDAYHVIARSAFGDLYFWGERTGCSLTLSAPGSFCVPHQGAETGDDMDLEVRVFFSSLTRKANDFAGLFAPALRKLGRLKYDEMYGFVPALALGGPSALDHLERVKAVAHLVFLAQLAPLQMITYP